MHELKNRTHRLLKWSEKYTKTDMVYLARNGFWLLVAQIFSTFLVLVLSVFFANVVPKDIYGNYKFVLSIIGILGTLSLTGMGGTIVQAVAQGKDGVLIDAVKTNLKWGLLLFFAGMSVSAYYFLHGNQSIGLSLAIASVTLPILNSFSLYGNYFQGKKDFRLNTLYSVSTQILVTLSLITAALLVKNTVIMVGVYYVVSAVIAFWCFKHIVSKYNINEEQDHTLTTLGKHMSVMNVFGAIANQLDKILVFHYLGAVELAVYSFSLAIPEQIKGMYKSFGTMIIPKYAAMPEKDLRHSIIKKWVQLTGVTVIVVALVIVMLPYVFEILFPRYPEAVRYAQIYTLGLLALPGVAFFATYFQIKKATKTLYKMNIINNVSTILLAFILIYNFGLLGAVIENGLSWFIMVLVSWYYFAKDAPVTS